MLTQSQLDTLEVIIRVSSTMSLIALIVVLSDLASKWPRIRIAPSRIIVWWMVSMIIPLPFMFLGRAEIPTNSSEMPSTVCKIQASFISFGCLASALWATLLALNVYLIVVRKTPVLTIRNAEWLYHLVAWGIPLLVAGVPIVYYPESTRKESFYGDGRLWCWISSNWREYRLWFFYVPVWIAFLITLGVYAAAFIQVCRTFPSLSGMPNIAPNGQSMQARNRLSTKTALYLAAFFFSYSGASINRVAAFFTGTEDFTLYILHAATIPSIGTFAALAYFGHRVLGYCTCRSRRKKLQCDEDGMAVHGADNCSSDWDTRSMTGETELALVGGSQASQIVTYYKTEHMHERRPHVPYLPDQGRGAVGPPLGPPPLLPAPAPCRLRHEGVGRQSLSRAGPVTKFGTNQVSLAPRFPLDY